MDDNAERPWPTRSIAETYALLSAPGMPFEMEEMIIRGVPTRVYKNARSGLREKIGRAHV